MNSNQTLLLFISVTPHRCLSDRTRRRLYLSGRQPPTLSNRAISSAGAHFPPTGSGPEARFQSASTGGASLRYSTLDGLTPGGPPAFPETLPKVPAPFDNQPNHQSAGCVPRPRVPPDAVCSPLSVTNGEIPQSTQPQSEASAGASAVTCHLKY